MYDIKFSPNGRLVEYTRPLGGREGGREEGQQEGGGMGGREKTRGGGDDAKGEGREWKKGEGERGGEGREGGEQVEGR